MRAIYILFTLSLLGFTYAKTKTEDLTNSVHASSSRNSTLKFTGQILNNPVKETKLLIKNTSTQEVLEILPANRFQFQSLRNMSQYGQAVISTTAGNPTLIKWTPIEAKDIELPLGKIIYVLPGYHNLVCVEGQQQQFRVAQSASNSIGYIKLRGLIAYGNPNTFTITKLAK